MDDHLCGLLALLGVAQTVDQIQDQVFELRALEIDCQLEGALHADVAGRLCIQPFDRLGRGGNRILPVLDAWGFTRAPDHRFQ